MTNEQRLLQEAVNEITRLRTENSLMGARLDMFDKMFLVFTSSSRTDGVGMGPDLAWEIQKYLDSKEAVPNTSED